VGRAVLRRARPVLLRPAVGAAVHRAGAARAAADQRPLRRDGQGADAGGVHRAAAIRGGDGELRAAVAAAPGDAAAGGSRGPRPRADGAQRVPPAGSRRQWGERVMGSTNTQSLADASCSDEAPRAYRPRRRRQWAPYFFIAPFALVFLVFVAYPLVWSV